MKAVLIDGDLVHAAGRARDDGADCVVFAADGAVADGMKNVVAELHVQFGMNCRTGGLEDMVSRVMEGEFDYYRYVLVFSSLTDAMRAAVMGLKFSRASVTGRRGGAGGPQEPEEEYAKKRLAGRGVEVAIEPDN